VDARLGDGDAAPALSSALDAAATAACAEAAGTMAWLLETTAAYLLTREQFGRPLAAFQVIQHRLARMSVAVEEAEAMALYAALAPPARRARAVAHAKSKTGRGARFVAQQAVQLHGGMGVTEELPVGAAFQRLMAFEMLYGTTAEHAARAARLALAGTEGVLA
jgi:alkylation response protein AidB-like acyl-CoA dehydrogenase